MKKTYKRNKNKNKKTKKIQKGGRILGQGVSGIVFYEPKLNCENGSQPNNSYVSKLTTKEVSNSEMEASDKLKNSVRNIGIIPEKSCKWNKNPKEYKNILKNVKLDHLVFSKFGGISLDDLHFESMNKETLIKYLKLYVEFIKNVRKWSETYNMVHNDIHKDNIIFNERFYLIDFEQLMNRKNIISLYTQERLAFLKNIYKTNMAKINRQIKIQEENMINLLFHELLVDNKNVPEEFFENEENSVETIQELINVLEKNQGAAAAAGGGGGD